MPKMERTTEEVTALCEKARELYLNGKVREAIALSKTMTVEEIQTKAYRNYFCANNSHQANWHETNDDYDPAWSQELDRGHFDWDE